MRKRLRGGINKTAVAMDTGRDGKELAEAELSFCYFVINKLPQWKLVNLSPCLHIYLYALYYVLLPEETDPLHLRKRHPIQRS